MLKKALAAEAKHDLAELEERLERRQEASGGQEAAGGLEGNLSHAAGGGAGEGDGGAADWGRTCGPLEKDHSVGEKAQEGLTLTYICPPCKCSTLECSIW